MLRRLFIFSLAILAFRQTGLAQPSDIDLYNEIKNFELSDNALSVNNLVLQKDRVKLTFTTGTFFFEAPVNGAIRGAVFIGQGVFHSDVPNSIFEREHVRRMLNADVVDSDFETAVLRFTDDTFGLIRGEVASQRANLAEARKLASEFESRLLPETSLNLSARMVVSIANGEAPGIFLGEFDKGRRGRFGFAFDPQGRIPSVPFGLNGGESGVIFAPQPGGNVDIWMAFYALDNYQRGVAPYSDAFDIVDPRHYDISLDVRDPGRNLRLEARIDLTSRFDRIRAIPFELNASLPRDIRVKRAMRVKSVRLGDGERVDAIQEEFDGGVTVFLSSPKNAGEQFSLLFELEGDIMFEHEQLRGFYYPISTTDWVPRHGYLRRSTYAMKFLHRKDHLPVTLGEQVRQQAVEGNPNEMITEWSMTEPAGFATFAVGEFELHEDKAAGSGLPIQFYSLRRYPLKEDFITAEIGNAVNYFTSIFGPFPFKFMKGAFHPRAFGQGFPTLLMLAPADRATNHTFSFIAHETAHQWWGNVVSWRSYRDQWLSEGFAEYSGMLYTRFRDGAKSEQNLIGEARRALKEPPTTRVGVGKGKLNDVGPLILGFRVESRETQGAYTALTYSKGALVLRMLHFLFTDTSTGDGQAFFDMMKDFVDKHRGAPATTDSFREIANQHFLRTPMAMRYQLKDLNWFFSEWVYQTALPSYRMEYRIETAADGVFLNYTVFQDNAGEDWFNLLPLRLEFGKDQSTITVHALGPQTTGRIRLPAKPSNVQFDPDEWILSENTSIREVK